MAASIPSIFRLECKAQAYDWGKIGSGSKVAQFAATTPNFHIDENKTYAELWMGTHPNAPSTVFGSSQTLEQVLAANPSLVTEHFHKEFHGHLPFLFKVLSIEKALSIQAHPDKVLAKRLFQDRPDLYKDDNHKPEMAIALTDFEALCGFRPLAEISDLLNHWPEFWAVVGEGNAREFQETVQQEPDQQQSPPGRSSANAGSASSPSHKNSKEARLALQQLFRALMTTEADKVVLELNRLVERLSSAATTRPGGQFESKSLEELLLRVHGQFPGDVGVFAIFFLNYIILEPGKAIFLAANEPHAYLSGDCVECMAASDNVVRAGLTPKFKDVQVLTEMLTYESKSSTQQLLSGVLCTPTGHSLLYDPPIEEFSVILTKLDYAHEKERLRGSEGPSVVLVTSGHGSLWSEKEPENQIKVEAGQVYFVGADTPFSIEAAAEDGVTIYTAFSVQADKMDHRHH